jgi:hypothetical protein
MLSIFAIGFNFDTMGSLALFIVESLCRAYLKCMQYVRSGPLILVQNTDNYTNNDS